MKKIFVWILFFMICMPAALAIPQPSEDFYVLDEADVLSEETEGLIVLNNDALYEACGAQIVFVTVDTTGETELEDYAYELFNEWGIGSAEEENGVLALLVIEDDTYYVMQGRGLEETLTSGTLGNLNNHYLEPHFAEKDYDAGVQALFAQLFKRVAAIYGVDITMDKGLFDAYIASLDTTNASVKNEEAKAQGKSTGVPTWLILVAVVAVIVLLRRLKKRTSGSGATPMSSPVSTPKSTSTVIPPIFPTHSRPFTGLGGRGLFGGSHPSSRPVITPRVNRSSVPKPGMSSRIGSLGSSHRSTSSRPVSRPASRPSSRPGGFGGGRSGGGGSSRGGGAGRGRGR